MPGSSSTGMLASQGIVHVWEAGTLVIRAGDETTVDELIDHVEMSEQPSLDPTPTRSMRSAVGMRRRGPTSKRY